MLRKLLFLGLLALGSAAFARSNSSMRWVGDKAYFDLVVRFNYQDVRSQAFWNDYFEEVSKTLYNSTEGVAQLGKIEVYMNDPSVDADIVVNSGTSNFQTGMTGGYFQIDYWNAAPTVNGVRFAPAGNIVDLREIPMVNWGPKMVVHELSHYLFALQDQYKGAVWDDEAAWTASTWSPGVAARRTGSLGMFSYGGAKVFDVARGITENTLTNLAYPGTSSLYLMNVCATNGINWIDNRTTGGCRNAAEFTIPAEHPFPRTDLDYDGGTETDYFTMMANVHPAYKTSSEWDALRFILQAAEPTAVVTVPTTTSTTMPAGYTNIDFKMFTSQNSIALLFDISASMTATKIAQVVEGGTIYLNNFAKRNPHNDRLGIFAYNHLAQQLYPMTEVTATNQAQVLGEMQSKVTSLPSLVSGNTSIGAGLNIALGGLSATAKTGYESIILLSDGLQNTAPAPATEYQDLKDRGVQVNTISFGSNADKALMETIASTTGGVYRHAATGSDLAAIFSEFQKQTLGYYDLMTARDSVTANAVKSSTVSVANKDKDIQFSLVAANVSTLGFELVDPLGGIHTVANPNGLTLVKSASQVAFQTQQPLPGNWTARVRNLSGTVTPYRMAINAGTTLQGLNFNAVVAPVKPGLGQAVRLIAAPTQGGILGGVSVNATVIDPKGRKTSLVLRDDGMGADLRGDDGNYTAWFAGITESGTYEAYVDAQAAVGVAYRIGDEGQRQVLSEGFQRQYRLDFVAGTSPRAEQTIELGNCTLNKGANWAAAANGVPFSVVPKIGDFVYLNSDGPDYAIKVTQASSGFWTGFSSTTYTGVGGTGRCSIILNRPDDDNSFVCAGACASAIPMTVSSATLNSTGEVWYKVDRAITGWQVSNFQGRTIEVNGQVVTPGQMPLPKSVGGVYYFRFTPGANSWASWSTW